MKSSLPRDRFQYFLPCFALDKVKIPATKMPLLQKKDLILYSKIIQICHKICKEKNNEIYKFLTKFFYWNVIFIPLKIDILDDFLLKDLKGSTDEPCTHLLLAFFNTACSCLGLEFASDINRTSILRE